MELVFALEELDLVAKNFANTYSHEAIFCFEGEMGAGKTTFIKALCHKWEVIDSVSSPTYSIINKYACKNGEHIYHLDLFRLKDTQELIDIGFEELLDEGSKLLIEWPQLGYTLFSDLHYLKISIEKISENTRKIIIFT